MSWALHLALGVPGQPRYFSDLYEGLYIMFDHNEIEVAVDRQAQADWERPQVKRLEAGAAEGQGPGPGNDNTVFS